ncbi:MAG TPA: hypothetical protein VNS58_15625 [Puia sp.]|nr:hypothetical protein [Puia sp.]
MTDLSFTPSTPAVYQAKDAGSTIKFFSDKEGSQFVWQGTNIDKVGTYQLQRVRNTYHLQLSFNYAREETFIIDFLNYELDTIISFRLTDRHGRKTEFTKVVGPARL